MGDNRENSTDSRSDQIGMICTRDVVGRAWLRYWPLDTPGAGPAQTHPGPPRAADPAPGASRSIPTLRRNPDRIWSRNALLTDPDAESGARTGFTGVGF